ncbi:MAG: hypothetical protein RLZZ219_748, partial [Cyanobacteriota bacterium]
MSRSPYGRQDRERATAAGERRGGDAYGGEPRRGRDPYGSAYDDPYGAPAGGRRGGGRPGAGGAGRPGGGGSGGGAFQFNMATVAVLAGVLIVGIGIGTGLSSTTQGNQGNIASSQQLDMAVADPEFCKQYGASAFVQDLQLYT